MSPLVEESVLSTLFVALLVGFAIQGLGATGQSALRGIGVFQRVVFKVLAMIMWLAPIGAFGAIAAVVGETGWGALRSLALLMGAFYLTCALFVFVVLGGLLKVVTGLNVFSLLKYLAREFLLIVSTSSSETALPRLIAKMEHLGVSRPVVGITVPTGYSFNLDGTAIYLTMASLFIAEATGQPLSIGEQIGLLVFMIIASKGAAGVTGAGLATLAGGLQSHAPELVQGVSLIVGIDRFMSEARAVTNFAGNAVATVLIGHWVGGIDRAQVDRVLAGEDRVRRGDHARRRPRTRLRAGGGGRPVLRGGAGAHRRAGDGAGSGRVVAPALTSAGADPGRELAGVAVDAVDDGAVEPALPRQAHPVQAGDGRGSCSCTGAPSPSSAPGTSTHPRSGRDPVHHSTDETGRSRPSANRTRSPRAATTRDGTSSTRPQRTSSCSRRPITGSPRRRTARDTRLSRPAVSTPVRRSQSYRSTPSRELGRDHGGPGVAIVTRCVAASSTASCAAELPPPTTRTSPGGTSSGRR